MNMVLEWFMDSRIGREQDTLRRVLQKLADHGAQINSNGAGRASSLIKFVKASTELESTSLSTRQKPIRPSSLLGCFLSANRNPLCWFPKEYCPAHECKSFAAFIFAHTPNSGLSALLIESSDMTQYGLDLVRVLLKPCRLRYSSANDPSIDDLLRNLLKRMRNEGVLDSLERGLLNYVIQDTPRKERLEHLETLLESNYISEDECKEALSQLGQHDEPFRLAWAERLFSQSGLAAQIQDSISHFFNQGSSRMQFLTDDQNTRERFQDYVLDSLSISTPDPQSAKCIVRSVVHVFTKLVLEGKHERELASTEEIISTAACLRRQYELPDTTIANDLLLALCPTPER